MYDLIIEIGQSIWKNGLTLSALVAAIFALLKQRKVKRIIRKRLPFLLRDDADVVNYEARQIRIENDVRAIKAHLGVSDWDADLMNGRIEPSETTGTQKKSLLQQAGYALATITRPITRLKGTYHLRQRRMKMNTLKSKLLSRKFILALATGTLVILNDGLGLGLNTETIMYVVGIVAVWITGESAIDIKRSGGNHAGTYGDSGAAE